MRAHVLWGALLGLATLGGGSVYLFHKAHAKVRTVPPVRVGVVDGARLKEAEPYQAITRFLEEGLAVLNDSFKQKRQELEDLEKKKRDPKIPAKKRAEYRKQFEEKLNQFDTEGRARRDQLRMQIDHLRTTVEETHMEIIRELSKKYHLNLILNTNTYLLGYVMVFHADETLDLTDEVIALLNKKLKNMNFTQQKE